jgi:predicted metalloprotease
MARSIVLVAACLALVLSQVRGAGAAGTLDRQLEDDDFAAAVEAVAEEIDDLWDDVWTESLLEEWESPRVAVVAGLTRTDCGAVKAGTGSFYCPADATVYLDLASLQEIVDDHGSIPAILEIVRQFGHHILARPSEEAAKRDPADRRQLAADCWAGIGIALAEQAGLLPLGNAATIASHLAAATAPSASSDQPGALRVEHFLSGYYLFDC